MAKRAFSVVLIALLFAVTQEATADIIYDASAQFDPINNPSNLGPWSYGYETQLGGQFILSTSTASDGPLQTWKQGPDCPCNTYNPTANAVSSIPNPNVIFPPHQLSGHPGPTGDYDVLRFTAPDDGLYAIKASFSALDTVGVTTDVHVLVNGTVKFNGIVNSAYNASTNTPGIGPAFTTPAPVQLQQGDTIDVAVGFGPDGTYYFDSTGLNVAITLVAPITDTLEDIGADGTAVTTRVIGGVTVTISTAAGVDLGARTYFSNSWVAFAGANSAPNAPLHPEDVSGTRFISTVTGATGSIAHNVISQVQPIVFDFSTPVQEFGLTTLDLLEADAPSGNYVTLEALDASGHIIASQTRTGPQGPSGLDLQWLLTSDQPNISQVKLTTNIPSSYGAGYGIDDLVVAAPGSIGTTIKTSSSYTFTVEQGAQATDAVQLTNSDSVPHTATLAVLNPHSDLGVSITDPTVTLPAGETKDISIEIDAGSMLAGAYDGILLQVTADDGSTLYANIKVYVVPQGAGQLPDLAISSKDIQSTTNADGSVTLTANVHNQGTAPASNVEVQFYEFDRSLGTPVVAQVPVNGIGTASITIPSTDPLATSGDHLVRVVVDPSGAIAELDKTNNEASQIVQIGLPSPTPGNILVTGSLPSTVYAGCLSAVAGHAVYAINVNGTTNTDYVVKGGAVQIAVEGDGTYSDIHTDIYGNFSKSFQAPGEPGTYHLAMTVTDQTFIGTRDLVFNVIDAPATGCAPPPPPLPPTSSGGGYWAYDPPSGTWTWTWTAPPNEPIPDSGDLRVFSEDIHFSKNNPAVNEQITIFAEIHYWASSTALVAQKVPVNLYVTDVTDPNTQRVLIGQTVIASLSAGSPDFGSHYVYTTWENKAEGVYIVEVEIDPSYTEVYMLNNAATRAIVVGQVPSGLGVISGQVTDALGGVGNVMIHVLDANGGEMGINAFTNATGFYLVNSVPLGTAQVHMDTPDGYAADAGTKSATVAAQSVTTVNFLLTAQLDTTPPVLTLPTPITVEATGPAGASVTYTASATDNVDGAITPSCAPASGSTFPLGSTTVNCSASDKAGNTATGSFTITVVDTTPPSITCPADVKVAAGQTPVLGTPTVSDIVDPEPAVTNNAPTTFPTGTTTVTWTATDASGNKATCTQQVTLSAPLPLVCDVSGDGVIDRTDISLIIAGIGQTPASDDPRDANSDGKITITDARLCTAKCTNENCAP